MPISQTSTRMDTEADEYLNEWREVSLTSVADIRFSSVNKVSQPGEEPVRLCNYTDVYNNDYVTADMDFMRATATKSEIERFGLQVGDVIITKDSETPDDIGIPTVVDTTAPDLVCGYHLALLRPNQDEVDPTFLAKQLAHDRIARYFGQQANGTTRYGLSTAAISNAPLHLPRPESQRSASALMRMVDAQIAQIEAVIAKVKQVRAGMLHDLLSYGLDEHGQLRDPITHPEQFQDSPLGLIPRDWDCKPISVFCDSYAGGTPSRGMPSFFGGDIPWVKSGEVNLESISATEETLTQAGFNASSTKWIPEGTPLIAMYGATAGQVTWLSIRATCNQAVLAIVPFSDTANSRFVFWYLRRVAPQIVKLATGSGQPNLSKTIIDRTNIALPKSLQEQETIAGRIDRIVELKNAEIHNLHKLEALKSGIQDDLLTGRVRVPETIMEGAENA